MHLSIILLQEWLFWSKLKFSCFWHLLSSYSPLHLGQVILQYAYKERVCSSLIALTFPLLLSFMYHFLHSWWTKMPFGYHITMVFHSLCHMLEVCPESIHPFWISREPVAWPWCRLGSHSEETLLRMSEQSRSRGASNLAVRCHWVSVYCVTVTFTNILPFNGDFSSGKSQKSQGAKSGL